MERESFEDDDEVAALLNSHFIAIKVDREERPDVDHIYMEVCQALTGQGGWPLTVILTPNKKPVFAGTYFPKESKWGRPGLIDILLAITKQWEEKRQELTEHSEEITRAILHRGVQQQQGKLSADMLDTAFQQLEASFDSEYGGFGSAPKFPMPQNLFFLLRYWRRTGNNKALVMAERTLAAMRQGGIYDHLGYGFARYSTDRFWLAPHFEKMLYDNALLCFAYLEAYQCTGNEDFARVAEEIITYVLRDMTSPDGAFYSAEDADSEGMEGKFYVFTREEIVSVLGQTEGDLFAAFYGISAEGNFEHGTNILNYTGSDLKTVAAKAGIATAELEQVLAKGRAALYKWREQRVHPYKDDKILTAWNGLMIAALAKAARVLNNSKYADAAKRALHFVKSHLTRRDGRLMARYRDGETAHLAYLDDYAFLLWGLFEMYQATFDPAYIGWALALSGEMTRLFWDEQQGGFYFYGSDGEQLLTRPKEVYDGAIPSGNSVASWVMLRLGTLTGDVQLTERAERLLESFAGDVQKYPKAYTFYLMALDYFLSPQRKLVIASGKDAAGAADMLSFVNSIFLPDTVVAFNDFARQQDIETILPDLLAQRSVGEKATAYICENNTCKPPVIDRSELAYSLGIEK